MARVLEVRKDTLAKSRKRHPGGSVWVGEWHQADGSGPADYDFGDVWANYFCFSDSMVAGMGLSEAA